MFSSLYLEQNRTAVALFQLQRPPGRHHRVQHVQRVEPLRKEIAPSGFLEHLDRRHLAPFELSADDIQAAVATAEEKAHVSFGRRVLVVLVILALIALIVVLVVWGLAR